MKIRLLAAALAVCTAISLSACSGAADGYTNAQGSVGSTHDDALVFAADPDSNQVFVFDTVSEQRIAAVAVGQTPEKILVGKDDTVFVTNRMGRSVSVIRRGVWSEAARINVGVEPVGLALSGDGRTLYVVSSTSLTSADFGILSAIDLGTLQTKWELPVGHEPRGLALLNGNKAMVSLFKDGDIVLVDLDGPKVVKNGSDAFQKLNLTSLNGATGGGKPTDPNVQVDPLPPGTSFGLATSRPRGMGALVVSPDGHQVFAATRLSSDQLLPSTPTDLTNCPECGVPVDGPSGQGSSGDGYGGGSCGATAVSSPALLTFDEQGNANVDDVFNCVPQNSDHPPMILASGNATLPLQGPTAAVVDPTGAFVFIVQHDSNNVAVVATSVKTANADPSVRFDSGPKQGAPSSSIGLGSVTGVVNVGAGPTGIALAKDGLRAWVYNSFDHSISVIKGTDGKLRETNHVQLGEDVLAPDVVAGRKLFFSAVDSRMNNLATGISCATCHLDGREDGHVWNFTQGPRQTPSLAGRNTADTAPFHWGGEFSSFGDFMTHTVTNRMGGSGPTPQMEAQIAAFIASIPKADNPNLGATLTPSQTRGAAVFAQAQCATCHTGAALTNNTFADVGTFVRSGPVVDDVAHLSKGLNVPSLLGLARSAPYLHDGSASTLKARILQGQQANLHGQTSTLSDAQVDDLVAYLGTL